MASIGSGPSSEAVTFAALLAAMAPAIIVQIVVVLCPTPEKRPRYVNTLCLATPVLLILFNTAYLLVKASRIGDKASAAADQASGCFDVPQQAGVHVSARPAQQFQAVEACQTVASLVDRSLTASTVASSLLAVGVLSSMLIVYTVLRDGADIMARTTVERCSRLRSWSGSPADGFVRDAALPADLAALCIVVGVVTVVAYQIHTYANAYDDFRGQVLPWWGRGVLLACLVLPVAATLVGTWLLGSRGELPSAVPWRRGHPTDPPGTGRHAPESGCDRWRPNAAHRKTGAVLACVWFVFVPAEFQQDLADSGFPSGASNRSVMVLLIACALWSGSGFAVIVWVLRRALRPVRRRAQPRTTSPPVRSRRAGRDLTGRRSQRPLARHARSHRAAGSRPDRAAGSRPHRAARPRRRGTGDPRPAGSPDPGLVSSTFWVDVVLGRHQSPTPFSGQAGRSGREEMVDTPRTGVTAAGRTGHPPVVGGR